MKILHINASDIGSTGKIVQDISQQATIRGWESVSLFPRRHRAQNPDIKEFSIAYPWEQGVYRRICAVYGLRYGCAPLSTSRALRIIRREKPDVVHLHSVNCYCVNIYRLLKCLRKKGIATVVTNHAEFFYTGNCPHAMDCEKWKTGCGNCPDVFMATDSRLFDRTHTAWQKMRKAFQNHPNIWITSVSPWVHNRSLQSPILANLRQSTILNGVNSDIFTHKDMHIVRKELDILPEEKVILHVTANFSDLPTDGKGGRYVLELARRLQKSNIKFLVAGKYDVKGQVPDNVTLLGEIRDQEKLADYYRAANLVVLTSKRETFGMAVAEALSCGTPVVGFESGGSESIAMKEYSQFVPFGAIDALENAAKKKWLDFKTETVSVKIAQEAREIYAAENMAAGYCDVYEKMVKGD